MILGVVTADWRQEMMNRALRCKNRVIWRLEYHWDVTRASDFPHLYKLFY